MLESINRFKTVWKVYWMLLSFQKKLYTLRFYKCYHPCFHRYQIVIIMKFKKIKSYHKKVLENLIQFYETRQNASNIQNKTNIYHEKRSNKKLTYHYLILARLLCGAKSLLFSPNSLVIRLSNTHQTTNSFIALPLSEKSFLCMVMSNGKAVFLL